MLIGFIILFTTWNNISHFEVVRERVAYDGIIINIAVLVVFICKTTIKEELKLGT